MVNNTGRNNIGTLVMCLGAVVSEGWLGFKEYCSFFLIITFHTFFTKGFKTFIVISETVSSK